jgi:hypothetical protein
MATVTLTLIDELPKGATEHDLRIVLMDALAEYVSHRANGSGEVYVNTRYPDDSVYSGASRLAKIESVNLRCKVANALHGFYEVQVDR